MSDETDSQSVLSCSSMGAHGEEDGRGCEGGGGDDSGRGVIGKGVSPGDTFRFFLETTVEKSGRSCCRETEGGDQKGFEVAGLGSSLTAVWAVGVRGWGRVPGPALSWGMGGEEGEGDGVG